MALRSISRLLGSRPVPHEADSSERRPYRRIRLVDHGADAILYWQWRDALNGQEQYHGAIVSPDGTPLPIYAEIQQLGHDLDLTRAVIAGTSPHAEVPYSTTTTPAGPSTSNSIPKTTTSSKSFSISTVHSKASRNLLMSSKQLAFQQVQIGCCPRPQHHLATVGGSPCHLCRHLILGPRSGMKDEYNSLNPQRQPGPLVEALGGHVEQFYALDNPIPVGEGTANIWAE